MDKENEDLKKELEKKTASIKTETKSEKPEVTKKTEDKSKVEKVDKVENKDKM